MNLERNLHHPLIVYGHDHCPYARLMAKMLVKYQIEHEWRDQVLNKLGLKPTPWLDRLMQRFQKA